MAEPKDFLNESTADFNKAIKQINFQLKMEGQLDSSSLMMSLEKQDQMKLLDSYTK